MDGITYPEAIVSVPSDIAQVSHINESSKISDIVRGLLSAITPPTTMDGLKYIWGS